MPFLVVVDDVIRAVRDLAIRAGNVAGNESRIDGTLFDREQASRDCLVSPRNKHR